MQINPFNLADKVQKINSSNETYRFNCWGYTAHLLGWDKRAHWLDHEDIDRLLDEKTTRIAKKNLAFGDVIVYEAEDSYYGGIVTTHTAVYIGNGKVTHKPGRFDIETIPLADVLKRYGHYYGKVAYYARPLDSDVPVQLPLPWAI